ncbi:MAG: PIN domain-containing protein [Chloroflexi bacterium]|nr:PIN domain-containing protein [Chloroflexota bacterium]
MADDFIDANIFLRHLTQDHPTHSPRATAYLQGIEQGERQAHTSLMIVFEVVFTLERSYKRGKAEIRDHLLPLLELPGILLPRKRQLRQVFELYVNTNISFADAYSALEAQRLGATRIISFDTGFDRVPGITRHEP